MKSRMVNWIKGIGLLLCMLVFSRGAIAGTLFTNPIILISPASLDFGSIPLGKTATNSFVVENAGGGTLVGTASVAAPFKIESGASYRLKRAEVQIVTVIYHPTSGTNTTRTVKFTGGGGAQAIVAGEGKTRKAGKP